MALMLFDPVDDVLCEIRRVLDGSGRLLVMLPGSFPLSWKDRFRYMRVLLALGEWKPSYPNQIHLHSLSKRLASLGFEVTSDERRSFKYLFQDEDSVASFVESLYARSADSNKLGKAVAIAQRWKGSEIAIPLRRVVCRVLP